jgi:hypothetical protein
VARSICLESDRHLGNRGPKAAAEVEPGTGTVVHAFTTGNVVQVFLFAKIQLAAMEAGHEAHTRT